MFKHLHLILAALLLFSTVANAQLKIGYVDSESIIDLMPEAQDARKQLDLLIKDWQSELNELQAEWKQKYEDYDERKLILSDQRRAELEKELMDMEKEIMDYRESKFGANGELFVKQEELMEPVQNKVFTAIDEIAVEEEFDFVFDRSGGVIMLFAKEEYDITEMVIEKLNL